MTVSETAAAAIHERITVDTVLAETILITVDSDGTVIGRCPFHGEGNDSGVILARPASGVWHCYACGTGGDVVAWVQRSRRVSRRAAIAHLWGRLIDAAAPTTTPG
jgi:DNA primase